MNGAFFDSTAYAVKLSQVEQFVVPPTSVLDASQGYWRDRRRVWESDYPQLTLLEERSTGGNDAFGQLAARDLSNNPAGAKIAAAGGVTVFDPVLAEVAYSWWSAPGSHVYDPFAGGPVRGVVAAAMGRTYLGVDIRPEQVDSNEDRGIPGARWITADSASYCPAACDFVFSCPPYGTLEQYGGGPADLSSMSWSSFQDAYRSSIEAAVGALKLNRFAAFVVGNYKERGELRDLASLTVSAFGLAGADYFGDLVFTPPGGSAALRAQSSFPTNRRPMPRHQMVLVFVKGDRRKAAAYVTGKEETEPSGMQAAKQAGIDRANAQFLDAERLGRTNPRSTPTSHHEVAS